MTTYAWFIRITRPYDEIKEWIQWIPATEKIAVQHDADEEVNRTHTHILVIGCTLQKQSIKTKLERMNGKFVKDDWAFPEYENNKDHVLTYMSKGKLDYDYLYGLEIDWDAIKAKWVEPKKTQTQLNRVCEIIKLDKMKVKEMIDRINLLIEENNDKPSIDVYLSAIRQVFIKENKCIIGRFKTRDLVDTLMAIHEPTEWKQSLKKFCEYRT